jgi:hypothetical protein
MVIPIDRQQVLWLVVVSKLDMVNPISVNQQVVQLVVNWI